MIITIQFLNLISSKVRLKNKWAICIFNLISACNLKGYFKSSKRIIINLKKNFLNNLHGGRGCLKYVPLKVSSANDVFHIKCEKSVATNCATFNGIQSRWTSTQRHNRSNTTILSLWGLLNAINFCPLFSLFFKCFAFFVVDLKLCFWTFGKASFFILQWKQKEKKICNTNKLKLEE